MFVIQLFQAYSNTSQKPDDREKVQWVQFQHADINCGLQSTIVTSACSLAIVFFILFLVCFPRPCFSKNLMVVSCFSVCFYGANFATNTKTPRVSEFHEFGCKCQNVVQILLQLLVFTLLKFSTTVVLVNLVLQPY